MKKIYFFLFVGLLSTMFVSVHANDSLFEQLFNGKDTLTIESSETSSVKKVVNISTEHKKILDTQFEKMKTRLDRFSTQKRIEIYTQAITKINKLLILKKTTKQRNILNYLKDLIQSEKERLDEEYLLFSELFGENKNTICNTDYIYSEGDCIKKVTSTSNNTGNSVPKRTCYSGNGYGNQFWYDTYRSKCYITDCESGYKLSNGVCIRDYYSNCSNTQHYENGYCVSNTRYCSISNGYGTQTWNGSYWGSCYAQSCNNGYYLSNGICYSNSYNCASNEHYEDGRCISNTRYCSISNGYGTQTWNGSYWGSCYAQACNSGYYISNGICYR